jgi:hypothetical protein
MPRKFVGLFNVPMPLPNRQAWVDAWILGGCLDPGWMPGSWVDAWILGGCLDPGWMPGSWGDAWILGGCLDPGWMPGSWVAAPAYQAILDSIPAPANTGLGCGSIFDLLILI